MTWKQLEELPGLISRAKFMEVTGLDDEEVTALVASGMPVWRGAMTVEERRREAKAKGSRQNDNGKGTPSPCPLPGGEGKKAGGKHGKVKGNKAGGRRGPYAKYYAVWAAKVCGFEVEGIEKGKVLSPES